MYFPTEVIYLPYAEISSQCMLAINIGRFKLGMHQSLLSQGTRKSRRVHPSRSCPGTRRVGAGIPHYSPQARGAKTSRNRTFHYSSAGVAVGFLAHRSSVGVELPGVTYAECISRHLSIASSKKTMLTMFSLV